MQHAFICYQDFTIYFDFSPQRALANLAGAKEFTDWVSDNVCPGYDIKQSDGEAPVLELLGMRSTPSLPLLPGSLWPGMVTPDRVLSMGQIKLFNI